jgi:hypothetical protein
VAPAPQLAEEVAPVSKPVLEQPLRNAEESSGYELHDDRIRMERNDVKNLRYQKPLHKTINPNVSSSNKKRADIVMLIAIVSAAVAIFVMLYVLLSMPKQHVEVELESIPAVVSDQKK